MKHGTPDAGTLEALVMGTDEAGDQAAWEWLVITPGSGVLWAEAVAEREELDRFSAMLDVTPWVAAVMARMRKLGRVLAEWRLEAVAVRDQGSWAASLGPSNESASVLASPSWGRLEPVTVERGTIVELRPVGETPQDVRFFYRSAQGEGSLQEGRWRLDPGEAPVMLVACVGDAIVGSLDEALARGTAVAGILLLEGSSPPEVR